jgi:hypothetical protein
VSWRNKVPCSECGETFFAYRARLFDGEQLTCGKVDCQRKRKTRLQRERREQKRELLREQRRALRRIAMRQRGSTVPQVLQEPKQRRRISGGWGNALRQRRSTLPQAPERRKPA